MNIYSFEFGTAAVNWFVNEWKNMNFIATRSRRFQGNLTFMRIDQALTEEIVSIRKGTYHSPAIVLPEEYKLINHNETMNVQLVLNNPSKDKYAIAIIIIDKDFYRMVDYHLGVDVADESGIADVAYPEVKKVCIGDTTQAAIIQFKINQEPGQIVPMILFNKLSKEYEYYNIYTYNEKLYCNRMTGDDVDAALAAWEESDAKSGRKDKYFNMTIFQPVTKYFVTTESKYDEMVELLSKFPSGAKHRKFLAIPDREVKYTDRVLDMLKDLQEGKSCATTFYGFTPKMNDRQRKNAPAYNFIMDETGKVTGI